MASGRRLKHFIRSMQGANKTKNNNKKFKREKIRVKLFQIHLPKKRQILDDSTDVESISSVDDTLEGKDIQKFY